MSKLEKRCEALRSVILSVSEVYHDRKIEPDQKKLIETIIGAAIWYLPHGDAYWTGKISVCALKAKLKDSKRRLTKEHQFPRKKAAEELLTEKLDEIRNRDSLLYELYEGKYALFNLVTSEENRKVSKYQKTESFIDPEIAYQKAKISLVEISKDQLKMVRKGDKKTIKEILKNIRRQCI